MHFSPFVPSIIFKMIPKSVKMVLLTSPGALKKFDFLFFFFFFSLKYDKTL